MGWLRPLLPALSISEPKLTRMFRSRPGGPRPHFAGPRRAAPQPAKLPLASPRACDGLDSGFRGSALSYEDSVLEQADLFCKGGPIDAWGLRAVWFEVQARFVRSNPQTHLQNPSTSQIFMGREQYREKTHFASNPRTSFRTERRRRRGVVPHMVRARLGLGSGGSCTTRVSPKWPQPH